MRTVTDLVTHGDGKLQTIAKHDMLGRVIETRVSDGATLSTTATATDGIRVTTDYIHTSGAPLKVVTSTPYRRDDPPADSTLEWTCTQFDRLGRPVQVAVFKGSTPPSSCAATANRTGRTVIAYIADQTTITDPADKKRVEFRDALGRLVQVTEDPGADPKLNYVTTYNYDPLDNLTRVYQHGHYVTPPGEAPQPPPIQSRSFEYSSLSRLRSATNPESGTTSYTYHPAGNLETRTDARGVLAEYGYDALQRLETTEYTIPPDPTPETPNDWPAPTPDVTYVYYPSGAPNAGRLKSITSTVDTSDVDTVTVATSTYRYDELGRILSQDQTIAGHPDTFTFTNTYYKNDALESQIYPSGRRVDYTVDDAGRVKTVSDGTTTYADMPASAGHAYAPDGRLQQMKLGNNLWETRDYHTPGTTTLFKLVTSDETTMLPGATVRVALGYDYHATQNNGNLMSHTITRSGTTWTQTFGYDGVNRLETANETNGYNRKFGYDAFGNRWVPPNTNPGMVADESHEPRFQSQFDPATNRMRTSQTVAYDAAGNQTLYSPHTLAYDAENRLKSMTHASSGSGTYLYDGQGRRVKKTWTPGGGTAQDTYYVYDIAGRLAAEYGTGTTSASGTVYPFTDMLGSVRAVTDANGAVIECYDYLPFGRMLSSSDNERSTSCHPADPDTAFDSDVSQKFTGQVRDEETRLDYFKARYMSAPQGRFLSPDPLLNSGRPWLPQSWNRYAYVMNNPLRFVDSDGLYELENNCELDDERCNAEFRRNAENLRDAIEKLRKRVEDSKDPIARERLGRALEALGEEGDGNRVVVSFETLSGGTAANVTPFYVDGVELNYHVRIDPNKHSSDIQLAITGAHEGNHVADFQDPRMNSHELSQFSFEYRSYMVSGWAAGALGERNLRVGEKTIEIWNRSWGAVDIDSALTRYLTTDHDPPLVIEGGFKNPWN